jgi:hypothetical protein
VTGENDRESDAGRGRGLLSVVVAADVDDPTVGDGEHLPPVVLGRGG